jgi:YHS domain-containing protein
MLSILIATLSLAPQAISLSCPLMDAPVRPDENAMDFGGIRYALCCGGCVSAMTSNPRMVVKGIEEKKGTFGFSLFDPVSGERVPLKKAKATATFKNIAYVFASEANRATFEASPVKFTKAPEKEAVYCPVMNHAVKSVAASGGFVDHEGVRYYVCCPNCLAALKADPAKFVGNAKGAVQAVKVTKAPKEQG